MYDNDNYLKKKNKKCNFLTAIKKIDLMNIRIKE